MWHNLWGDALNEYFMQHQLPFLLQKIGRIQTVRMDSDEQSEQNSCSSQVGGALQTIAQGKRTAGQKRQPIGRKKGERLRV